MTSKFIKSNINSSSIYIFNFFYYYEDELFIFLGNEKYKDSKLGKVAIRTPYWSDMYDINRMSKGISRDNPKRSKEKVIIPEKYKLNKIKVLVEYIEDNEGERESISEDMVDNLDIGLSRFILEKIDEVLDLNPIISLSKDEGNKLSTDCYKYYSAIKKRKHKKDIEIPEPPSIVILVSLSKMLNISIEEVKKMDKRDIDSIMIMNQQDTITNDPSTIGGGVGGPGWKALHGSKGGNFNMLFTGHNVHVNRPVEPFSITKKDLPHPKNPLESPKKKQKERKKP